MAYLLIPFSLVAAFFFVFLQERKHFVPATFLKGIASLFFVLIGLFSGLFSGKHGQTVLFVTAGLCFGALADVFLDLNHVVKKGGHLCFMLGVFLFFLGHLFYLLALFPGVGSVPWMLIVWLLVSGLLMLIILKRISVPKPLLIGGLVYFATLVLMASAAWVQLFTAPSAYSGLFAAGALLFLISDSILILDAFGKNSYLWMRIAIIAAYYPAQILIALSLSF